jgi:hypothetical protein
VKEHDAELLFSHDSEEFATYLKAPAHYT